MITRALIASFLLLSTAACAPKSSSVPAPVANTRADQLVSQGCYDCLLEARSEYERQAERSPLAALRLFETDVLLALREKELAVDSSASLARAGSLSSRLTSAPAERVLSIVKLLPADATGRRLLPATREVREELESAIGVIDAAPFSGLFKSYLKMSIQCGRITVERQPGEVPADEPALLAYRRAICENPITVEPLRAVRMSVPRFVETSLFLGRAAMASIFRTDGAQVRALFEEAYARFPTSPSVAFNLATVYQATNDCRRAEEFFGRTLELNDTHEDARLGRTICRTYLSKTAEAIADATVLIDAGASNRADAYYWRAWNHRRGGELAMARADIDSARALRYNAQVLTLAGMIEHDQKDFAPARRDLQQARDLDSRECDAPWYLALVEFSTEQWAASAPAFAGAADCYAGRVAETQRQRAEMATRADVSEEFRARQLAGFDAAIADDNVQRSAAELNAAINYGRAGDIPNATIYMKRAAVDPQRRVAVEDLRQVLGVPRW